MCALALEKNECNENLTESQIIGNSLHVPMCRPSEMQRMYEEISHSMGPVRSSAHLHTVRSAVSLFQRLLPIAVQIPRQPSDRRDDKEFRIMDAGAKFKSPVPPLYRKSNARLAIQSVSLELTKYDDFTIYTNHPLFFSVSPLCLARLC